MSKVEKGFGLCLTGFKGVLIVESDDREVVAGSSGPFTAVPSGSDEIG